VKDQQSEETVDRGVTHRGYHEGDTLRDEGQLEVRTLVRVIKVVCLQRQRLARIGKIGDVPHGDAEVR